LVRKGDADIFICDLRMPAQDGISIIQQVRKIDPDIELVILTGYELTDEQKTTVENLGGKVYLKYEDLVGLLDSLVKDTGEKISPVAIQLQTKVSKLEHLNRAWASHLAQELKEIEELEDALVSGSGGDGFMVKELIDDIQSLNSRGIKHIKLWIDAQERLRKIKREIISYPGRLMTNWTMPWFFLKRENKIALLFFPRGEKGDKDAIPIYYKYITGRHKRQFGCHLFEELWSDNYRGIFGKVESKKIPKSIMLFAHSNDQRNGFLVNSSHVQSSPTIGLEWWKCDIKYDWLFAHVCNGAVILKKPDWRTVFSNWLSYNDEIWNFVGTKKGYSCWRSVFHLILKEILKSKSIKSMKEHLVAIYSNAMAELANNYEPKYGDTLNLMYLEHCIQSIKTSEDYM